MVQYQVTVQVRDDIAVRFAAWMRTKHIPEIMALDCFVGAAFEQMDDGRFRTRYVAVSRDDLDRYLQHYTDALRADFAAQFPDGVSAARQVWTTLERWGDPGGDPALP